MIFDHIAPRIVSCVKRPFRVPAKIDSWVKGAIGWVFRVPAPILGHVQCCVLGAISALPIAPTGFHSDGLPVRPQHIPVCPPHACKVPARPLSFRRYHSVLVDKKIFPALFLARLEYMLLTGALCQMQSIKGVCKCVCKMASRSGRPRRSTRTRLMPQNRWKMLRALENLDDLVTVRGQCRAFVWAHRAAAAILRLPLE